MGEKGWRISDVTHPLHTDGVQTQAPGNLTFQDL
jgi:hypothetical protein